MHNCENEDFSGEGKKKKKSQGEAKANYQNY